MCRIRARGAYLRESGGNYLKYFKRMCNRKNETGNKHLKRGQAGLSDGCLKRRGWNPLRTMI